jgi:glucose-1-phosphate cytidylyltransferase
MNPKVLILAGGLGTRISEETADKPKPMVLIDDKPILWHLMNSFADQGFRDFILALGYRSEVIKRWLIDLNELDGDIQIDTSNRKISRLHSLQNNSWTVSALETGLKTQTGGRIKQAMQKHPGERVIATYGDGLANVDVKSLLKFHELHGKLATVTAVRPPARFGYLELEGDKVAHFGEKRQSDVGWINGGFFVCEPAVFDYITEGDSTIW